MGGPRTDCFGANPVASALGNRTRCDPGTAVRTYHEGFKPTRKTGTFYLAGNRNFLFGSDRRTRSDIIFSSILNPRRPRRSHVWFSLFTLLAENCTGPSKAAGEESRWACRGCLPEPDAIRDLGGDLTRLGAVHFGRWRICQFVGNAGGRRRTMVPYFTGPK